MYKRFRNDPYDIMYKTRQKIYQKYIHTNINQLYLQSSVIPNLKDSDMLMKMLQHQTYGLLPCNMSQKSNSLLSSVYTMNVGVLKRNAMLINDLKYESPPINTILKSAKLDIIYHIYRYLPEFYFRYIHSK